MALVIKVKPEYRDKVQNALRNSLDEYRIKVEYMSKELLALIVRQIFGPGEDLANYVGLELSSINSGGEGVLRELKNILQLGRVLKLYIIKDIKYIPNERLTAYKIAHRTMQRMEET